MALGAREYLMVVKESAFKTPKSTPTPWIQTTTFGLANFDLAYVRLADGNGFGMRPRPVVVETPYGGGIALPAYVVSDKQEIKGKLRIKLCIGQSPLFLSWAGVRIAGGTAPWTTSESNGDLPSCSVYHAITSESGTVIRKHYAGVKVDAWTLTVSEASTEAMLDLDLTAAYMSGNQFDSSADPDGTEFPPPADNSFPIDPYVFIHAGGSNFVTFGGTVRTQFTELNISSQNRLARAFFANRWIQLQHWKGRRTTVALKNLYTDYTDRTHYEGLASESVSIELNNATHGVTFDLKASNVFNPFEDDLPLGELYFQSATSLNMYDQASGTDLAMTFA